MYSKLDVDITNELANKLKTSENIKERRKNLMFKRSCEDPGTLYVCLFGKRYIFRNGKYEGWYRP